MRERPAALLIANILKIFSFLFEATAAFHLFNFAVVGGALVVAAKLVAHGVGLKETKPTIYTFIFHNINVL